MTKKNKNPLERKQGGAAAILLYMVCTMFFAAAGCGKQETSPVEGMETPYYYYQYKGGDYTTNPFTPTYEKRYLRLNTQCASLWVKEPHVPEDILQRGITAGEFITHYEDRAFQYNDRPAIRRYWTELSINKDLTEEQYLELLEDIKNKNSDVIIGPYFNSLDGIKFAGEGYTIHLTLKKEDDEVLLVQMTEQTGSIIINKNKYDLLSFIVSVTEETELFAMEITNIFYETELFRSVDWGYMLYPSEEFIWY